MQAAGNRVAHIPRDWRYTILNTENQVFDKLLELSGKAWLYRGQPSRYGCLVPSIDRGPLANLSRLDKLSLERRSIVLFRSNARFFGHPGEEAALTDDFVALMVLRHHEVPTRLLDWSKSPYVAAYFAACENDEDGEIWSFDEPLYEKNGKKQWKCWPETTRDGSGDADKFSADLTAFATMDPPKADWFICGFYLPGFHRQNAQNSVYTLTARFGRDHAEAIANLLDDEAGHHLYVVPAKIKAALRLRLFECFGIWHGSLFPDSAGAAQTAKTAFDQYMKGRCRS